VTPPQLMARSARASRRLALRGLGAAKLARSHTTLASDYRKGTKIPVARPRGLRCPSITPVLRGPVEPRQFIGLTFGQACHDAGIAQSMGAVGTCYDNAVAETFFATLTKEMLLHDPPPAGWATRAQLRSAIFEYIEGFYNPSRLHSTLGMRSPVEYEEDHAAGDPDGLARARTHAHAREKTVDNLRLSTATTTKTT
jgi:transposase InsO family protein